MTILTKELKESLLKSLENEDHLVTENGQHYLRFDKLEIQYLPNIAKFIYTFFYQGQEMAQIYSPRPAPPETNHCLSFIKGLLPINLDVA